MLNYRKMLIRFTCSSEHVRDFPGISSLVLLHPEEEELHHAGDVVLVGKPGQHLHVEVAPAEVPGVDVIYHLLDGVLISLLDVDLLGSSLHHIGLNCGTEHWRT